MTTQGAESIQFHPETMEFIQEWKEKPGNLIMILHKIQEDFGYIPKPAAIKLSEIVGVPLAKIYGVITFYHYFKLEKPGKHKISVCTGTACYLKGSDDILLELEQILGIGVNATTPDGGVLHRSGPLCGLLRIGSCGHRGQRSFRESHQGQGA
jgi:NADH-quinone oxidoreductase subunit E